MRSLLPLHKPQYLIVYVPGELLEKRTLYPPPYEHMKMNMSELIPSFFPENTWNAL